MVDLVHKGRSAKGGDAETAADLIARARHAFGLSPQDHVRLLHKGKQLREADMVGALVGKVMVLTTSPTSADELNTGRADPTVRGFEADDHLDAQRRADAEGAKVSSMWRSRQDPQYKFARIEVVAWQQFGHRPGSRTPHAFAARELLESLAADPGVVACMRARELVVGTLGEMDPIDDRLMHASRTEGADLLGYNTNHGMRIDIKLRTDDLEGFVPYPKLVGTLLHELCHNWVGPHNRLFWTLYAQMRVEYLHEHLRLAEAGSLIDGKTTASLAGVEPQCVGGAAIIAKAVFTELAAEAGPEMAQGLVGAIKEHLQLMDKEHSRGAGPRQAQTFGAGAADGVLLGAGSTIPAGVATGVPTVTVGPHGTEGAGSVDNPRGRAAAAAEARLRAARAGNPANGWAEKNAPAENP